MWSSKGRRRSAAFILYAVNRYSRIAALAIPIPSFYPLSDVGCVANVTLGVATTYLPMGINSGMCIC